MQPETAAAWRIEDSFDLYRLEGWGNDYFSINESGHIVVHPDGPGTPAVDLKELVDEVRERGIGLPLLVRFNEILRARLEEIHTAFEQAIDEYGYENTYRGVYPIKVNQDRAVVEKLVEYGRPHHYGLEAGSKPELLAVIAMLEDNDALIVCNGYKDEEYVETALLASRLGRKVVLVVENPSELPLILECARKTDVTPRIGVRSRLSTRGSGHWENSGGDRSKFGLGGRELLDAVGFLKQRGLLGSLELLHFHIGSQVSSIRALKDAIREASWIYVNLVKLGAPLRYLDVGGGLGVDYDGSRSQLPSSVNYSLQEYANDVVAGVMEVCDPQGVPHPVLVSESGRATVAHHAVLVGDVLGAGELAMGEVPEAPPVDAAPPLRYLFETYEEFRGENLVETFHDVAAYRDECASLFGLGHLSLKQRVLAEDLFWATCRKILHLAQQREEIPTELEGLESALAETYFCNFSIFQSLPDVWAIEHLFPIVPLHRLAEEPTERAILADITCDSDGQIDRFIGDREPKSVLELHPFNAGEPYLLGVFLVGAYQEILGDLHNLFGDTNEVSVSLDADGGYRLDEVVTGDTVTDVLEYVGYHRGELMARLRRSTEVALRARQMTLVESRKLVQIYEEGLAGYTYLERD